MGFSRIQPRFERPRGERGGEQDADLWGLRFHGLYPILPRSGVDRERPGQVAEITSATAGIVSSHELEPDYRNSPFGLRIVLILHPAAFSDSASRAPPPRAVFALARRSGRP